MRRSGWLLPIIALVAWVACVGFPATMIIGAVSLQDDHRLTYGTIAYRSTSFLLITSIGWAVAVAMAATLIGWGPGRLLGKSLQRRSTGRFVILGTVLFLPICIPSYVVFYAWWQSWPADSAVYQWVVQNQSMQAARHATLFIGLVCWSWPLVSWCVAGQVAATPAQRHELMIIDGVRPLRRIAVLLRNDARGLIIGALLVFLATLANTTCFDLAEVFTFSNELRAIQAMGASPRMVLMTAWPSMLIGTIGVIAVWMMLAGRQPRDAAAHSGRSPIGLFIVTAITLLTSVAIPMILFTRRVLAAPQQSKSAFNEFFALYGWSTMNTIGYAAISAVLGALIAIGLAALWHDHRRWIRSLASVVAISWLIFAVVPGAVIGIILHTAYNQGTLSRWILDNPAILIIAHLTCFGFAAAIMARWMVNREPKQISDLRKMDGAFTLGAFIVTAQPRLIATALASFAIVFVMAIGEIPVTAVVVPPHRVGAGPLTLSLLNDMHYQRPTTVMIAILGMMLLAALAALVIAMALRVVRSNHHVSPQSIALLLLMSAAGVTSGCTPDDPNELIPLKPQHTFGVSGIALGQFAYPRAMDVDANRDCIYVVDKQARVQRLGFDGVPQLQWMLPEKANGKPTGITVAPDGRVFVADTHYFRVIAYDADGNELTQFGEFGRDPGQFIYTTDVAFGPNDQIYVSEYGGNDRIQVFDSTGRYLFHFGSFGSEPGQLNRPQSIAFNREKTQLFIADACNHRISVFSPDGTFIRTFGHAGRAGGELTYPYGVSVLDDGTLLVAEFGNNRLQRFDQNGNGLGMYGGIGRGIGQLQYPWAVASIGDRLFVLDSGNNRVQVVRKP